MLNKPPLRRAVALLLVVLGALVMFFAPGTWPGVALLALGVALELVGIALRHRDFLAAQACSPAYSAGKRSQPLALPEISLISAPAHGVGRTIRPLWVTGSPDQPDCPAREDHMKTQTIHLPQPPLTSWRILIILVSVASFIALTGFTSRVAAVSPAPTLETGADEGAKAPDTRWPVADAEPAAKCRQCGVVAAMREIAPAEMDAAGAQPGSVQKQLTSQLEVTVLMRDGSRHVFRQASPSIWRVGERMIIINSDLHAGA